jgi:putative ABC transport system permease protein
LVKSFIRLRGVDLGFRPDRILSLRVDLSKSKYPDARSQSAYFARVIEQIRQLPGVDAVGADAALPLTGYSIGMISRTDEKPQEFLSAGIVNAEYFRTMGIPLKKGRLFTDEDRDGKPKVALVNESYARSRFANQDPLGKQVAEATIVGVVGDVRQYGPKDPPPSLVYLCYLQRGYRSMSLAVRTRGNPLPLAKTIRDQIQRIDRTQPIHGLATLEQSLADTLSPQRLNMLLASALGVLALGLVSLGIYGVLSFSVAQRVHEIGVRMALGAQSGNVVRLVIGEGLKLALAGVVSGLLAAFALTRYLSSLLYGVTALDPSTFAEAAAFLLVIAVLACYLPARRAARVDPITALRCE